MIKVNWLLLFLLGINSGLYSQNLSLSNLVTMCSMDNWGRVNSYLQNKDWTFYDSEKGEKLSFSIITWSFEKSSYNDKAQAWIYLYTFNKKPAQIKYSVFNKSSYNLVVSGLSRLGFKQSDSQIGDDAV